MNANIRRTLAAVAGIAALGSAATAFAGESSSVFERLRDRVEDRRSEPVQQAPARQEPVQPRSAPAPTQPVQPRERSAPPPPAPAPSVDRGNPGGNSGGSVNRDRRVLEQLQSRTAPPRQDSGPSRPAQSSAPPVQVPRERNSNAPRSPVVVSGGSSNGGSSAGNNDRAVMNELLARTQRGNSGGGNGGGGNRGGGNGNGNGNGNHDGSHSGGGYHPPRIVPSLPRGYRNYYWNDQPYYTYGGSWYQPYGSSYISIGVPYGLFVSTLPGYSSSFYYGSTRYYYYDDTYYVYEPARRGYVVSRSPYGEDEADGYYYDAGDGRDQDMFIYPARGQSEQQQADDRYECHRWAVDQTRYNPLDDAYDRAKHADYVRAMTACLTGRGYSVR